MLVADSMRELDLPHAVVCRDQSSGVESFSGPYPSGLAALCAAEAEHLVEFGHDPDSSMVFAVVPLMPPADEKHLVAEGELPATTNDAEPSV